MMTTKQKIEIFSAGCSVCDDVVTLVKNMSCPSCDVSVLNMNDVIIAQRAKSLGIKKIPAVLIDGELADCCSNLGVDKRVLQAAGIGQPIEK